MAKFLTRYAEIPLVAWMCSLAILDMKEDIHFGSREEVHVFGRLLILVWEELSRTSQMFVRSTDYHC